MSRAFVKEDVDPPERTSRKRSGSGLPPGAINYLTARGAAHFQAELTRLRKSGDHPERVARLEEILASAEIVEAAASDSEHVSLGATVTTQDVDGNTEIFTVVGVDELELDPHAVSWISSLGKALLAARIGDRVTLEDGRTFRIMAIR